eukprot:NODE_3259_length_1387_cov_60.857595_g2835_i0.p1 GENE.NODE_3259_length_1387_cov_60.857595_g2835_i0~~NODE_3259_length_1387_cov_60.857595_g2835_i0.p1  ORF type:complete len:417 (+),score=63.38 NODE_3259_length_1387_cov_60.857595_g2835_i0:66-1316(+)
MSIPLPNQRAYQIVVFGATGYTGKIVAEYLAKNYGNQIKWALAGRNKNKLQDVKNSIGLDIPLLEADVNNVESLQSLVKQTKVVITTVGPYEKYGTPLVEACVKSGTHYCDLTGEVTWVRSMIDLYHSKAQETGARIVHCCGFDCIPFDLGVLSIVEYMRTKHKKEVGKVKTIIGPVNGGVSGGTIASVLNSLEQPFGVVIQNLKKMNNPYLLIPIGAKPGKDKNSQIGVWFDWNTKTFTAPFLGEPVNSKIVRRSSYTHPQPYGPDFSYSESAGFGGIFGIVAATFMTVVKHSFVVLLGFPVTRWILKKTVLPAPGQGPSEKTRKNGYFTIWLVGQSVTKANEKPIKVKATVGGKQDPGYGETAKMLSEAGLALALDFDRLPNVGGGIYTPAIAIGSPLIDRLKKAGMTWDLVEL